MVGALSIFILRVGLHYSSIDPSGINCVILAGRIPAGTRLQLQHPQASTRLEPIYEKLDSLTFAGRHQNKALSLLTDEYVHMIQ